MAQVLIDLNQAGLDLEPEEMEAYALRLAEELREDLAEEAGLAREEDVPEGAMSGAAAFLLGILKAEVNATNLLAVMKWLWNLRPNTVLKLSYKNGDREFNLEYRTQEQLEQQIAAIRELDSFTVQLIQTK
ncbi:sugar ABC transporter permease [Alkalinema sp. FACHB-956]|uniref:sugar ABC transporter permease n=1 Tax=Alkalinema sp. FACHB-956 TaxID=2692768 RepID=UPI00168201C4|nr:sugar ABC transporter permease [Alkalinema sp. FACHB-956]MBD2328102.1 sugar ABC transporter permease [Alkalinema sp. FACHB-956]